MAGINTTGKPRTTDYQLGRGKLYAATLTEGVAGAYRDLGNCPEFSVTGEIESLEHQSSRGGLRVTDKRVTLSQTLNISFTLDEINHENLALFYAGSVDTSTVNAAIAGFAEHEMIASVEKGRWYDIKSGAGLRAFDIEAADLTVEEGVNALVLNTDYELDLEMGRIFFLPSSSAVSNGDAINVTLAAEATARTLQQVAGLLSSSVPVALKFIAENPANSDVKTEYQFHQVTFSPEGDSSLIGDDWTTLPFSGTAERNETVSDTSKTLTITTLAPAS